MFPALSLNPCGAEGLRVFYILPAYMMKPARRELITVYMKKFLELDKKSKAIVCKLVLIRAQWEEGRGGEMEGRGGEGEAQWEEVGGHSGRKGRGRHSGRRGWGGGRDVFLPTTTKIFFLSCVT